MTENEPAATTPRSAADALFSPGRFFILLIGIVIARFPRVVLGQESFFYRDYGLFTYPIAHYYRDCFWRGQFPLWNPLNNFGVPLFAQWNTALLYPPAIFYLIFPLTWALGVFELAHLVLAGMGMYFLARRWTGSQLAAGVAGMAFAFNGLTLHSLMWISNLAALAWMPWAALAAERAWHEGGRWLAWAALAGGAQMLSGAPELIILTWAFIGVVWLGQFFRRETPRVKMFWRMVLVCALIGGLAAVQLLPFMELLRHSQRDMSFGDSKWAMPGWGWANFFVPLFRCTPSILGIYSQDEQQWTSSYYMGIGVLALAWLALGKRSRQVSWLWVAVLAGVVLSMGDNAHVYGWLRKIFPVLGVMRYPIKFVVLTVFALPLVAAHGVECGMRSAECGVGKEDKAKKMFWLGILSTCLAIGLLTWGVMLTANRFPIRNEVPKVTWLSGETRLGFLVLVLGAVWVMNGARTRQTVALAGAALMLLIATDALTHAPNQNPTVPAAVFGPMGMERTVEARYGESRALVNPKLQSFLYHAAIPDAVAYYEGLRKAQFLDCNLIDGIPTGSGFFSLELGPAASVATLLNGTNIAFPEPLADFVGASQISSTDTSFTWTARTNFMPLATAGQKPIFVDKTETLRRIASQEFEPRATVYLPEDARGQVNVTNQSAARVTNAKFTAQREEFDVDAVAPAMVVVSQAFYPLWHAYVDGARVKLWLANGAFQALEVPAGKHAVKIVYEDRAFEIGFGISAISFTIVGCLGIAPRRFRK